MGKLHLSPAADLTAADKLVLAHLQKDYEQVDSKPTAVPVNAAEGPESLPKHTEFVSTSAEGEI